MAPRVSVLVVNYNSGPHLIRCVEALARQTMGAFEAIVVDNASADMQMIGGRPIGRAYPSPSNHWAIGPLIKPRHMDPPPIERS